jgi:hypothetical protein
LLDRPERISFREREKGGHEEKSKQAAPHHLLDRLGALDMPCHHARAAP